MLDVPEWADVTEPEDGYYEVVVDTHDAYPALLQELVDRYQENRDNLPDGWVGAGGDLKTWAKEAFDALDPEDPDEYWIAVARQMTKMDLWASLRTMNIRLKLRDADKRYREDDLETGRGQHMAEGGVDGPRECVDHYRALRGFVPAPIRA